MAIKKSNYAAGGSRGEMPSPYVANTATEVISSHAFTDGLAAGDILELAHLPAYCRLLDVEVVAVGTAAVTVDVGFMSGTPGSNDAARTSGDELFKAVTPTTASRTSLVDLATKAGAVDVARSIGLKASAAIPANAATKLYLRCRYATGGF